ncbi:diguanylate cyclase, partial [Vibrio parahaemolyticus]|uniref:diguanylate cyclase n=1 Tax=Vibrio parahaemolyticus TaxID=670 RepID=UPI0021523AF2
EMSLKNEQLNSLGLVFIDVDHLKIINDTEGHVVGDEVLSYVGSALKNSRNLTNLSHDMAATSSLQYCQMYHVKNQMIGVHEFTKP